MASIKEIAQDIGVSAATVSNALTGKGRVSKELAERIQARAEALGYRPSRAARALKTGQSGILGLVMPDLTNPLFPHLLNDAVVAQFFEHVVELTGHSGLVPRSPQCPG